MRFPMFALLIGAVATVNAHFELAFPPPRGVFDDDNEVNFCGSVRWVCRPFKYLYSGQTATRMLRLTGASSLSAGVSPRYFQRIRPGVVRRILTIHSLFHGLTLIISWRLDFNRARSDIVQQLHQFIWGAAARPKLCQWLWGRQLLHSPRLVQHWN